MQSPVLETERLILRPVQPADAEAYFRYFNDWEIIRHLGRGVPWPYTKEAAENYISEMIEKQNPLFWMITKKDRGEDASELIGAIEFFALQNEGQRGFWLARQFQNQGLITEASIAVTDYWFNVLKKTVLRLRNAVTNPASRRIKEKTGARFTGIVKKEYMDLNVTEAELWEITAEEWRRFRS
jgi:RimJ/RimL family protein N-acetyltransferase